MSVFQEDKDVTKALQQVGLNVSSVYDLVNSKESYPQAIPVLLDFLPKVKDLRVKEGIVRALTVKKARGTGAAEMLITEFSKIDDSPNSLPLKWAIGNALSVIADDEVFEKIVDLVYNKKHGKAREMLVSSLANMKDSRAVDVLIELLQDEETVGHAAFALGKLKVKKAKPHLERLLNHPKAWVRKEAKRALEKIDRAK